VPPVVVSPPARPPVVVTPAAQPSTAPPAIVISTPSPAPAVPAPAPVANRPPAVVTAPPSAAPVAPVVPVAPPPAPVAPGHGTACHNCGYINKLGARFCGNCGASLAGRPPARIQVLGPRGVLWERRIAPDENPFVIGRRSLSRQIFPHIDLTYSDPSAYVSRRHAQIIADAQGYSLEDLGSENGTYLNSTRLPANQPVLLHNGDIIQVGKVQMQFAVG
jgi:hypothetical protein